jgi:hypothetical protein
LLRIGDSIAIELFSGLSAFDDDRSWVDAVLKSFVTSLGDAVAEASADPTADEPILASDKILQTRIAELIPLRKSRDEYSGRQTGAVFDFKYPDHRLLFSQWAYASTDAVLVSRDRSILFDASDSGAAAAYHFPDSDAARSFLAVLDAQGVSVPVQWRTSVG